MVCSGANNIQRPRFEYLSLGSSKCGQNPSFKQVCSGSTSDQTHIFVQVFAQIANIIKSPTLLRPANVVKSSNIEPVCSGSKCSQSRNFARVSKCF